MIHRAAAAVLAAFLLVANSPANLAATAFGARESIQSIDLSPDGRSIAYVAPAQGQGAGLYTVDLATGQSRLTTGVDGRSQRLGDCSWVSNSRLVCSVFMMTDAPGELVTVSRMVALDRDGSNARVLGQTESIYDRYVRLWGGTIVDWLPGEDNFVLMGQTFIPEQRERTNIERSERGYGVVRVDTRNLRSRRAEPPNPNASQYISDGRGNVRIMGVRRQRGATGQISAVTDYLYRATGSSRWQPLGEYDELRREGVRPLAVDPESDTVYAFRKLDGRTALYRIALDGSGREELVLAHDEVDIEAPLRLGRSRRVIGATFATERRQAVYFDPELRALADRLRTALPGTPLIDFADASDDESKLLIYAGSDTDPGRYYIYDKGTRQLEEIMLARPQLEGVRLAEVRPVRYRAADGTMIPAYLTLPPGSDGRGLPAIVMPHGGPDSRDVWGFDWLSQYYANRGYAVLQPNFRGSAGYGDQWFQVNGFQSWRTAIGDVADAGRWLISEGIADSEKLAAVGWSYGGYAALQANVLAPDLFRAAVAIAPVTDLNLLKEERRRWSDFAVMRDYIGSGPHTNEGSPADNAAAIRAPVLLFHGDMDRNVGVLQSRRMDDRLRTAGGRSELIVYPGLDHYLEDSRVRADMLSRSDAFLRAALGM